MRHSYHSLLYVTNEDTQNFLFLKVDRAFCMDFHQSLLVCMVLVKNNYFCCKKLEIIEIVVSLMHECDEKKCQIKYFFQCENCSSMALSMHALQCLLVIEYLKLIISLQLFLLPCLSGLKNALHVANIWQSSRLTTFLERNPRILSALF